MPTNHSTPLTLVEVKNFRTPLSVQVRPFAHRKLSLKDYHPLEWDEGMMAWVADDIRRETSIIIGRNPNGAPEWILTILRFIDGETLFEAAIPDATGQVEVRFN